MMGQLKRDQEQLFYSFRLDEVVPDDHLARAIAAVLDLSWVYAELASYYPKIGRPSIDPVLMIRMLIVGYVFAIRSERALCREVQVNLAYRWFCGLSIEDKVPDHSALSRVRNERFGDSAIFRSAPFLLRCMSLLMAHHDGYCAGTECRLSGYCGSSRWHGSSNQLADYDA
jgi:transposase